jgi:hypothetical protein
MMTSRRLRRVARLAVMCCHLRWTSITRMGKSAAIYAWPISIALLISPSILLLRGLRRGRKE